MQGLGLKDYVCYGFCLGPKSLILRYLDPLGYIPWATDYQHLPTTLNLIKSVCE